MEILLTFPWPFLSFGNIPGPGKHGFSRSPINIDLFTPRLIVFYPCIVLSLRGRDGPNSTFLHIFGTITRKYLILTQVNKYPFFEKLVS